MRSPRRPRSDKRPRQLQLGYPPGRGGKRARAGRKPNGPRAGVWHVRRPDHDRRHPVHVTLRTGQETAGLRTKRKLSALRAGMREGGQRFGFRLVHFSVQGNHIHLLCEAENRDALRRGLQGLCIRLAKSLNRELGRRGKVFSDRYHARALKTPTETRRALQYVLGNHRKHSAVRGVRYRPTEVDPYSTALDFDGWSCPVRSREDWQFLEPPTVAPQTWLMRGGWKRAGGLLDPAITPG